MAARLAGHGGLCSLFLRCTLQRDAAHVTLYQSQVVLLAGPQQACRWRPLATPTEVPLQHRLLDPPTQHFWQCCCAVQHLLLCRACFSAAVL